MPTLNAFVARADAVLTALEQLLRSDGAETPLPDPTAAYPIPTPTYDPADAAWVLSQSAADPADGLYKGIYRLALASGCARPTILSQNVSTPPDGIPARYEDSQGWHTVTSASALNAVRLKKIELRSTSAFTLRTKLMQTSVCEDAALMMVPATEDSAPGTILTSLGNNRWRAAGYSTGSDCRVGFKREDNSCFHFSNLSVIQGAYYSYYARRVCDGTYQFNSGYPAAGCYQWIVMTIPQGSVYPVYEFDVTDC